MTIPIIPCPGCGSDVAQADTVGGGWCVRTKIVKVGPGGVTVRCRNCGELVALPLIYQKPAPQIVVRRSR